MDNTILSVRNLTVLLDGQEILDNINFDVEKEDILAVIGPNGAGKTMLFRALLNLVTHQGIIKWRKGVKIGYVPQRLSIEPDLPLATIEFLRLKEKDNDEIYKMLQTVGFEEHKPHIGHLKEHILNKKIGELSGGEFQRILIAWSLLGNPDVLLFDEPTSGVDLTSEKSIYSLLSELREKKHLTILLISHELHIVFRYATKVLSLNKKMISFGPPSMVINKRNLERLFGKEQMLYNQNAY